MRNEVYILYCLRFYCFQSHCPHHPYVTTEVLVKHQKVSAELVNTLEHLAAKKQIFYFWWFGGDYWLCTSMWSPAFLYICWILDQLHMQHFGFIRYWYVSAMYRLFHFNPDGKNMGHILGLVIYFFFKGAVFLTSVLNISPPRHFTCKWACKSAGWQVC